MAERIIRFGNSTVDFSSNVVFDDKHQRQEVSFRTPNLKTLSEAQSKGWTFKQTKDGYLIG